jgi:hypothetical protein
MGARGWNSRNASRSQRSNGWPDSRLSVYFRDLFKKFGKKQHYLGFGQIIVLDRTSLLFAFVSVETIEMKNIRNLYHYCSFAHFLLKADARGELK